MDPEKSNSSSFEDLSNIKPEETEQMDANEEMIQQDDNVVDIIGNGQLVKKILKKGIKDERPNRSDLSVITYTGKLENGTIVEAEKNFVIQVGDLEVVQGLDMAIPLMCVGEEAEISVDSRFAYGTVGLNREHQTFIPPSAKIIYNVVLISTKEEDDLETLTFEKRKIIGNKKRERGNFWFDQKEYNLAIQLYRRALEYLDDIEGGITDPTETGEIAPTNSQLQDLLEDRVRVYNNLAMAQMKISAYDAALKSVDTVLRCQANNVKALFRKGKILDAKNDTNEAIPVLQKAAILDPESKAIQQMLSKLILKQRREARNEKDLYQKMLGHAQMLENKKRGNNSDKDGKLKLWGYLMGSILIGVAGVAMYRYKYF